MLLWSEGTGTNALQCQQTLDLEGKPTSASDTCIRMEGAGADANMAAASSGNGRYVVAWHQQVNGRTS